MRQLASRCRYVLILSMLAGFTACDTSPPPEPEATDSPLVWASRRVPRCAEDSDCRRGEVCEKRSCGAERGFCVDATDECPDGYVPECGCDGRTYPSACDRRHAGVALHHPGECTNSCGGIAGITCAEDQVCLYEAGTCGVADRQGVCVDRPEVCPDVWQPVCGCDGQTYGNRCDALAAGASIEHAGECRVLCKSDFGCEPDELCLADGCGVPGECTPRPNLCPSARAPVCGCNGETYINRCSAHAAGVSVAYDGQCRPTSCITDGDCRERQFCELPECSVTTDPGARPIFIGEGQCVDRPEVCPLAWAPVCGCDGVTYDNDCSRRAAGASKAHEGVCEAPGCWDNSECGASDYCALAACDARGQCEPRPDATTCGDVREPVCGCDGVTYDNACVAAAKGASVMHAGRCERTCGGVTGNTCEPGEFCDPAPGLCTIALPLNGLVAPLPPEGTCVPIDELCPGQPVCGCDGKTYANDCERVRAGVGKDHDGACDVRRCEDNGACGDSEYCAKAGCFGVGVCSERPEVCTREWAPVCGCDGATYSNRCVAAAAGTNIAHEGECEARCGGLAGVPCDAGEWCDPPAGVCGMMDPQGTCVAQPDYCPLVYAPVCGCDGKTYSNDCFRIGAGVAKDREGRCECSGVTCDMFCRYGYALDDNGCELCQCNPPPVDACCDPADEPGRAGNPTCFEGATCCGDGTWRCNDAGGASTCDATDPAVPPTGPGKVCEACCDPASAPPCFEGATCCGDGTWRCNGAMGEPACDVRGRVCECPLLMCPVCLWGNVKDANGCDTCECNAPPADECCEPAAEPDCGPWGATCCHDGGWKCNTNDGTPACELPVPMAATDAAVPSEGVICAPCCDPAGASCPAGTPPCEATPR